MLKKYIHPALGSKQVDAVRRRDVERLHQSLSNTPYHANRVLTLLSKMFSLAMEWDWRTDNPCQGIQKFHEEKRERWLKMDELRRLTDALDRSTNKRAADAVRFLKQMARLAQPGGHLLIGVDLKKDPAVLNAAYNDSEGYTAAFNMNLFARMNSKLNTNFQLRQFRHLAFYNEQSGRVEMHLVSRSDQVVRVGNTFFEFSISDIIHTENSYKYSIQE